MIPLLCISQQKYIIKGDTIVGYTLDENRSIALLFMKGEMYEELYFTQNEILAKKDSIINTQYYHIKFQDNTKVNIDYFITTDYDLNWNYLFKESNYNENSVTIVINNNIRYNYIINN